MKKILLVLGILSISALGFADAKSDFENAQKLASQKKINEAVKVLEGVATSSDKAYSVKANFQLGAYYLQNNNRANAKKYLSAAWKDPNYVVEETLEAARLLYLISLQEKNVKEAEKYITWADEKTNGKDVDTVSSLIIFYFDNNMQSKGQTRYSAASKSGDKEFTSEMNFNIGQYYLGKNNTATAKKYLQDSYNQSPNAVLPAGYLLSQIALSEKNNAGAEKILLEMNTKTGNKNAEVLGMLGSFYLQTNNLVKAEDYLKKSAAADRNNTDARLLLLALYESKNDAAKATAMYNEIKGTKGVNAKTLNKELGVYFAQFGNGAMAEKYLKKSINEDKDNEAKVVLGQVYFGMGKKAEAIAILKEAVNNKVKGAAEVLKQVESAK
ncbi:MAG: hypothetical protein Q4D53_02615 [Leptotrichiaceae bacterium]|nr:hypothetical protein [Leptotrichiaceae bacterium]